MSCWCCLGRGRTPISNGEVITLEKLDFESVREQMINDFVAAVSADAVKELSDQQGPSCDPIQGDVMEDTVEEVTRDFSQIVSKFDDIETDDTDDGLGVEQVEDDETKQIISQILDMGVYQPGIRILDMQQQSDQSSDPESESGVSMTVSPKQSSRKESSEYSLRKKSVGFKRLSTVSNPVFSTCKKSSVTNPVGILKRGVSLENGGDPETQGHNSIDVIQEDALLQGLMRRTSMDTISCEELSSIFLDNVR